MYAFSRIERPLKSFFEPTSLDGDQDTGCNPQGISPGDFIFMGVKDDDDAVGGRKVGHYNGRMKKAAVGEEQSPEYIRRMIAEGKAVIPNNTRRSARCVAIGAGLRTKVNASIGTSSDLVDVQAEVEKAIAAETAGPIP